LTDERPKSAAPKSATQLFIKRRKWGFEPVEHFDEQELIEAASQVYMEIADHNPQTMGKSKACYSALQRITAIYARLAAPKEGEKFNRRV
jgi:hypothetical protein